jgi:hypothetical protein
MVCNVRPTRYLERRIRSRQVNRGIGAAAAAAGGSGGIMKITSIGRNLVVLGAAATLLTGCGGNSDGGGATPAAASATGVSAAPASASPSTPADNGVAALEPSAIVGRARAALKSSKSFRIKGTVNEDGQQTVLDFKISGTDVVGTMRVGKAKVQLLRVGGKQYMKPDAAFWKTASGKQADAIIQVVGDRWVKVSASNKDFSSLFTAADVDGLLAADGKVTKGRAKVIAGTPAIGLVDHGSQGGTLYVATVGKPYPLRIDGPTAAAGGLAFSEFGATFTDIMAPATADVLDLAKLGG